MCARSMLESRELLVASEALNVVPNPVGRLCGRLVNVGAAKGIDLEVRPSWKLG